VRGSRGRGIRRLGFARAVGQTLEQVSCGTEALPCPFGRSESLRLAQKQLHAVARRRERGFGITAALLQCLLILLVRARAEQPTQQFLPLVTAGEEELREAVLR